jgi:pheromone shutdown-related protein TraB
MTKDDTLTRLKIQGREYILVGTAHVSRESVEEVVSVIRDEAPDRVCVEIGPTRYKTMTEKQSWSNLNIYQVIREKKVFFLLGNYVLASFQKRLGLDLGVKPGEEMMTAIRTAQEENIPFSLCDREIQVTLKRAWAKAGFWGKNKLLAALLSSAFSRQKLDAAQIEELKRKSALEGMMEELADYLPSVKEVLIDERDRYLASKIFNAPGEKIVAVVGAGHIKGMVEWLKELHEEKRSSDLSDINSVPPPKPIRKVIPWLVPAAILGLFIAGFFMSGWEKVFSMFWKWVLVNGTLSALGALAALAHPLTLIASFIAAPITSMNPTIGVGIVTGILEAVFRKPRVIDFENLQEDILTFKGFYRNRFTHILLVFLFSSLGSAVGTFIGIPYLTALLA